MRIYEMYNMHPIQTNKNRPCTVSSSGSLFSTETAAPPSLVFSMESTRKITRAKHHPYTGGHKATMSFTTSGPKSSYMKDGAGSGFCPIKAAKSRMLTAQRSNIITNTWRSGCPDILLVSMVFMANWTAIPLM